MPGGRRSGRTAQRAIAAPRPDVFISYSRRDKDDVQARLAPALEARGKDVWIDVDDIRGGASDWRATVWAGIEASKVVVFVLSPDSLASRVCMEELEHASALNKRVIPVLRQAVDGLAIPAALERPNWILARDEDDVDAAVAALVAAVETDEAWLDMHARLTQRTAEWLLSERDASYVLRGSDLRAAERWEDDRDGHAERPTSDQIAYINAGRRAAARRQRLVLGGVLLALGVSIALGIAAYVQRQTARSQAFAARAIDAARRDPEEGLRLALDAADLGHGALVQRALRETVAAAQWTRLLRDVELRPLLDVAFSPDDRLAVTAGEGVVATVWSLRTGRRVASLRHGGPIHGARFSPDGTRIVTASSDGSARVWDTAGRALRVLRPGPKDVWSADFDGDGRRIVTATDGGAAQVWRVAGGAAEVRLPASGENHLALTSFSPDGRRVLTSGAGDSVLVRTPAPRSRSVVLRHPAGSGTFVTVAAFSPDGRRVVTGDDGGLACLWTLRGRARAGGRAPSGIRPALGARAPTGGRARSCHAQAQTITDVAFSDDGTRVLTASGDGTTIVRATAGGRRVARLRQPGPVNTAAFAPGGRRVVTGGDDRHVRIWSATGDLERDLGGHTDSVAVARFSHDGTRVLTGSDDASARVWMTRADVGTLPGRPLPGADVAFSPDSTKLLAVDVDGAAAVWDLRRGTRTDLRGAMASSTLGQPPCDRFTGCAPWSPDSHSVAGASASNVATIWDAGTGRATSLHVRDATGAAFSPDGRRLAIARYAPGALVVDRAGRAPPSALVPCGSRAEQQSATRATVPRGSRAEPRGATPATVPRGSRAEPRGATPATVPRGSRAEQQSATFSADGRLLLTVSVEGDARISDAARGTSAGRGSRARAELAGGAAMSPDGARLAVGTPAGALEVHDVRSGAVRTAVSQGRSIKSIAFDRSGDRLVTAGDDRTARVWNPAALGSAVAVLRGHGDRLLGSQFSPDGRFVLTAGADGTARLWDPGLETSVAEFAKPGLGGARFSPDGRLVAIGGRTVEVHRCVLCAPFDELVRVARSRLPAG